MLQILIDEIELKRELTQKNFSLTDIESFMNSITNIAMKFEDL